MIRPLAALTRLVQQFFHDHLVGVYDWEQVEFAAREKNVTPPVADWPCNGRGRRIRPEPLEGKHQAVLRLRFGPWDLTVEGSNEHPPLGWLTLEGFETIEGPLDAATWDKIAEHIKQNHMESENGTADSWS